MSKRRWWVTIRQSAYRVKADVRPISAPTLAAAEGQAQRYLRAARLTKVDGPEWDTWEVRTSGSPHRLPVLVAHGDHEQTRYTVRNESWWKD